VTLYSFDTSVLIESWNRRLPPATFVSFWERLDEVINAGTVRAVDEVRNELTRDDNLKEGYSGEFVEVQAHDG
jgi:Domain of unknown function (DUF4411)